DATAEVTKHVIAAIPPPPPVAEAVPTPPERAEFRFELESPQVVDGAMLEPITGRMTIEGWVLARSGVTGLEVFLDDHRLGEAHYGLARQDVGVAFPDWDNSLRSGYAFHCPPRSLRNGSHDVRLVVRARNGQEHVHPFNIEVKKADDGDEIATIRRKISRVEANVLAHLIDGLDHDPEFHLILRTDGAIALDRARVTIDSLGS